MHPSLLRTCCNSILPHAHPSPFPSSHRRYIRFKRQFLAPHSRGHGYHRNHNLWPAQSSAARHTTRRPVPIASLGQLRRIARSAGAGVPVVCRVGCLLLEMRVVSAVILSQYHADSGGSFEIVSMQGAQGQGGALMQMSPLYPSLTDWVADYDPITSLGDVNWTVTRSDSMPQCARARMPPQQSLDYFTHRSQSLAGGQRLCTHSNCSAPSEILHPRHSHNMA